MEGFDVSVSKKKPPRRRLLPIQQATWRCYLSWVEMLLNLVLRLVPIELTVAMITTEIPAAINPYSIAVAPDSSLRNAKTRYM